MKSNNIFRNLIMALLVLLIPVSLLIHNISILVSDKVKIKETMSEHMLDKRALAVNIKGLVNELMTRDNELKEGMMIAIFSKATIKDWEELIEIVLPYELRFPLAYGLVDKIYDWPNSDKNYPELKISTQLLVENVAENTPEIFRWAYKITSPPPSNPKELNILKASNFGDSLPPLLLTGVPDSLTQPLVKRGGELMLQNLKAAEIPAQINITENLQKNVSPDKMETVKKRIDRAGMFYIISWSIIILLITLLTVYSIKRRKLHAIANVLIYSGTISLLLGWFSYLIVPNLIITRLKNNVTSVPKAILNSFDQILQSLFLNINQSMVLQGILIASAGLILYIVQYMSKQQLIKKT